jgi:hypothetical protein
MLSVDVGMSGATLRAAAAWGAAAGRSFPSPKMRNNPNPAARNAKAANEKITGRLAGFAPASWTVDRVGTLAADRSRSAFFKASSM